MLFWRHNMHLVHVKDKEMRLEWLEDIIAVIETGSFSAAAERRFVTQPAFSRRIRAIEEHLGAELFDRDRKPVALRPLAANHQDDFRRLVAEMTELLLELRRQGREAHNRIAIASQHALTATYAPRLVESLLDRIDTSVRLRSANRDECLAMLMTKQVDLLINYQSGDEAAADPGHFLERAVIGAEQLIPVFSTRHFEALQGNLLLGELPVISYPSDAFLGRLFNDELLARLPNAPHVRRKVETALTLAALEFAIKGIGVAWLPESVAREAIDDGRLRDLGDLLPAARLTIVAVRLINEHTATEDLIWREILAQSEQVQLAAAAEGA
jgi:DNA-binding transcriptional LysR family regulator